MSYLSLESSSTRKVEKDIVNFSISIFVERKNTIEEAIKLVSDWYVTLNNSFREEFNDLIKIKKIPLISGVDSTKVEQTIGNKVETKYIKCGYKASCVMILSFKLDDIRKSKLNISRIYDIVAEMPKFCSSTINYSITISDEAMKTARKELQKQLLKDARIQAENILIDETDTKKLKLEEVLYHVEESNKKYGSDMIYARKGIAESNNSSESVMSPEVIKLLILEDIELVTIMDTIITKWIY